MIDLTKPLYTKRGGVVTGLKIVKCETYPINGTETYQGDAYEHTWMIDGKNWDDGYITELDLTNTPPASVEQPAEAEPNPDIEALRNEIEDLKHQLRQAHKASAEAWRVALKHQRIAAKAVTR